VHLGAHSCWASTKQKSAQRGNSAAFLVRQQLRNEKTQDYLSSDPMKPKIFILLFTSFQPCLIAMLLYRSSLVEKQALLYLFGIFRLECGVK